MSFILEHENPVFKLSVDIYLYLYRAGIYLFAFIKVRKKSVSLELLGSKSTDIHECDRSVASAEFLADIEVHIICILDVRSYDAYILNICKECSMTAVVRPVSIYHAYFSDSRITMFLVSEIILTELDIVIVHSKSELVNECMKSLFVEGSKAFESLYCLRYLVVSVERVNFVK